MAVGLSSPYSSNISCGERWEIVEAMRRQEETYDIHHDYLLGLPPPSIDNDRQITRISVDASCRKLMADWCNSVVKFCEYSHETSTVAMSCLDRFVCTARGGPVLLHPDKYQLAAITALYIAAKIHESEPLDLPSMTKLVNGKYSENDVEIMERAILREIQWRVNPPTPMPFVSAIFDSMETNLVDAESAEAIIELANYQTALALSDYKLSLNKPSSIAYAALLTAIESVDGGPSQEVPCMKYLESTISHILRIEKTTVEDIRVSLCELASDQSCEDCSDLIELLRKRKCWQSALAETLQHTKHEGNGSPRGVLGTLV